jgi:DNA-directed RNA polymerase specialized sigma24 family protein
MTPIDPQPHTSKTTDHGTADPPMKQKWTPTARSFYMLLAAFSPEPLEAVEKYELARRKLVRYFDHHVQRDAEWCVDQTFDRAMRRIEEGKVVTNMVPYLYEIARYIVMEIVKEEQKMNKAVIEIQVQPRQAPTEPEDPNPRLDCFDRCLEELPPESRTLILEYYEDEGEAKIKHHTAMAKHLGITLNALRLRAHRIRLALEACVAKCMTHVPVTK